jgi:L-amino acid N-acyltransferase YncA
MLTRQASPGDSGAIARIYNEGIEDRVATFETDVRSAEDIRAWFDEMHPVVAVEESGDLIAFARTSLYRPRDCYAGIAEASVYVARGMRKRGAGRAALTALIDAAREAGFWKLVARIFPENTASRALVRSAGFREVGTYRNHGRLDGVWRDVVVVERLIPENIR